jgi:hypothetical protein
VITDRTSKVTELTHQSVSHQTRAIRLASTDVHDRRSSTRLAVWSKRRSTLAILLMVAFLCSGLLAVPVVAFLDHTENRGDAFGTATESGGLLRLAVQRPRGDRPSARPHGRPSRRPDEPVGSTLADMRRTDPQTSRLTWEQFDEIREGRNEVEISVPVFGAWRGRAWHLVPQ